jgi:hypothetical protein
MAIFLDMLVAILALGLVWWFVRRLLRPAPPEPVDDPFASVPAPRKQGPKGRAGAIALEEPDDDADTDSFPPRSL